MAYFSKKKILNLYSGIGGNRVYWDELGDFEITAVELYEKIAQIYKDRFPNDNVVVADAKEYLLENYDKFDFIWASPPCQSHSRIRKFGCDIGKTKPVYPDMSLYQIIIFLQNYYKGKWAVENVNPYYEPLIRPNYELDRHLFWCNFTIDSFKTEKDKKIEYVKVFSFKGFDLSKYKGVRKQQLIRNEVNYKLGKHILKCALRKNLFEIEELFEEAK